MIRLGSIVSTELQQMYNKLGKIRILINEEKYQ